MKKHFWKNRNWVTVAVEEIIIGAIIMLHYQQLDGRLPWALGLLDNPILGLIYVLIGLTLLVNSLWDFYWYRIRLVLIALSGGMWALLAGSYIMNIVITGNVIIAPFIFIVITINVFLSAWEEPRYKLKGGDRY